MTEDFGEKSIAELKPCPFCGGEAILDQNDSTWVDWDYRIFCGSCLISTPYSGPKELVIEKWNRRVKE